MKAHISKGHLSKKNENGEKSPIGPFLGANLPLRDPLKWDREGLFLISAGKAFQRRGAAIVTIY